MQEYNRDAFMPKEEDSNDNNESKDTAEKVNDALNAADDVITQFENMKNDYQNVNNELNNIISNNASKSNKSNKQTTNPYQFGDEIYPPPQPKSSNDNDEKADNKAEQNEVEDLGGFASAIHYCKHCSSALKMPKDIDKFPKLNETPECDIDGCHEKENWVCLKCHKVLCGRYGNKHMVQHYMETNTKHCIALGVGDLSFWCYGCDDYLHHLSIKPVFDFYKIVHQIKFGEPIPAKLENETDFGYNTYYNYDDDDSDEDEDEYDQKDESGAIKGRDPKSNPLTSSGANRGLGNVDSGKDTVLEEDQIEYV